MWPLTKKQVENSPSIDTQRPVSRQYESRISRLITVIPCIGADPRCGARIIPLGLTNRDPCSQGSAGRKGATGSMDSHLRSTTAVTGYHIEAEMAKSAMWPDLSWTTKTWAIRYIEVATRNWWPGKQSFSFAGVDSKK